MFKIKKLTKQKELYEALQLRLRVFVIEQQVDYKLEIDEFDTLNNPLVQHFGGYLNNKLIAYMRVVENDKEIYIGRVVTEKAYRGNGYNTQLFKYILNILNKDKPIILNAQVNALKFYDRLGFVPYEKKNVDANIIHQTMVYKNKK